MVMVKAELGGRWVGRERHGSRPARTPQNSILDPVRPESGSPFQKWDTSKKSLKIIRKHMNHIGKWIPLKIL